MCGNHDFCVFAPLMGNAAQIACIEYKQERRRSKLLFMLTVQIARSNEFKQQTWIFKLILAANVRWHFQTPTQNCL